MKSSEINEMVIMTKTQHAIMTILYNICVCVCACRERYREIEERYLENIEIMFISHLSTTNKVKERVGGEVIETSKSMQDSYISL